MQVVAHSSFTTQVVSLSSCTTPNSQIALQSLNTSQRISMEMNKYVYLLLLCIHKSMNENEKEKTWYSNRIMTYMYVSRKRRMKGLQWHPLNWDCFSCDDNQEYNSEYLSFMKMLLLFLFFFVNKKRRNMWLATRRGHGPYGQHQPVSYTSQMSKLPLPIVQRFKIVR
jgi:hypothetical protein